MYVSLQHSWLGIGKRETEIHTKRGSASPPIIRSQFALVLAWASTVHKVRGFSLDQIVVDFNLKKQKSLQQDQIYTALSRTKTFDKSL